jgi:hypothetical protein
VLGNIVTRTGLHCIDRALKDLHHDRSPPLGRSLHFTPRDALQWCTRMLVVIKAPQ